MKDFKAGDRVKIKKSSVYYIPGSKANPTYEDPACEGVVKEVGRGGVLDILVVWGNGRNNSYNKRDLKHVKEKPSSIVHVDDNESKLEVDFNSDSIAIYTTSKVVLDKSNVKALRKSLKQWLVATEGL